MQVPVVFIVVILCMAHALAEPEDVSVFSVPDAGAVPRIVGDTGARRHRTKRVERTARLRLSCVHTSLAGSRSPATFDNTMKRWSTIAVMSVLVAAGCSSNPKHLSAAAFQQRYQESKGNSLEGYTYLGETNGAVYIVRQRVPLLFGSKPHEKTFFTETNALPAGFIDELRHEKPVEQSGLSQ